MRSPVALYVAGLAAACVVFSHKSRSHHRIVVEDTGNIEPRTCAPCHRAIDESYRRTGMGRSFYQPAPANTVEDFSLRNTYFHQASAQYFTMSERGGRYYQRRHQLGPDGRQTNVLEK